MPGATTIDELVELVNKRCGANAIVRGGLNRQKVPTPSLQLNNHIGGGIPTGRFVHIYGLPGSGKTTFAMHFCKKVLELFPDDQCLYVDVENTFDRDMAINIGIDSIYVMSFLGTAEDTMVEAEELIRSGNIRCIVVDSIAALLPRSEEDKRLNESGQMNRLAFFMSCLMRRWNSLIPAYNVIAVFLNQLREKPTLYGDPFYTPGGKAIKHHASLEIRLRADKQRKIEDYEKRVIGCEVFYKLEKVKWGGCKPFAEGSFPIIFGHGISEAHELINISKKIGLVKQYKGEFKLGSEVLGSIDQVVSRLKIDTDFRNMLFKAVSNYQEKGE